MPQQPAPFEPSPGSRETGRLQVDGAQIHYEVCARGPAIVFAHGLGGNQTSWWQQVGQSMGGWTVVEYCLRHPQRVRGLVLSATIGSISPDRIAGLDPVAMADWQKAADQAVAQCRALQAHPACGLIMAREQPALHLLYQQIDEQARNLDKEAIRGGLYAMRVRTSADFAATGVPVLLISPQQDIVIPPPLN